MRALLRNTTILFLGLAALTGLAYPALVTVVAQGLMPDQALGSLVRVQGRVVGSRLIGQAFSEPRYFWGRPSATGDTAYNGLASGGSNLGPTNEAVLRAVKERIAALRAAQPPQGSPIPVDLVTASASGLDPHISPAAAHWQVPRVARARGLTDDALHRLVAMHTEDRMLGILGAPRVNVLELNLALDR
jgi:potassium-transporting ATPase KdpC subunit